MARRKKYSFIQYTGSARGRAPRDAITITRSGTIGLPARFLEAHGLTEYYGVVLHYDPSRSAIGVQFTKDREADSFKITRYELGGASVACASFFRHFGIDPPNYASAYSYKHVQNEGMPELYVIQLAPKEAQKGGYEEHRAIATH